MHCGLIGQFARSLRLRSTAGRHFGKRPQWQTKITNSNILMKQIWMRLILNWHLLNKMYSKHVCQFSLLISRDLPCTLGWLVLICKWCLATFCKLQWGSIFRLLIGNVSCNFNLINVISIHTHIYIHVIIASWLLGTSKL